MKDSITIYQFEDPYDSELINASICGVLEGDNGSCSLCDENNAEKEIIYERAYQGVTKRFKEIVCQECLDNDPEYFLDKNIIKIINL